ncbi:Gfo/Idh/MocA family oxidoreductase [Ornithinimicrobium pekingense]|uniref:Oxidoreductase n=1 Tax=Ornithinimicrobium pekingense TaxID=384677 RepID=A0ABQ2FB94_9MICO|nr:Gfo/Idh/MocA family oxidoreductase [Ornithinimicrobium pekingense]GGK79678.1 oxidoreductase [Ornithinimicrobium pekingense]
MPSPIRTAVVGYGLGGRTFHAPFLAADDAFTVDAVVTSDAGRAEEARADHPGVRVVPDLATLLQDAGSLDLVVVSTPPERHADQAAAVLEAGLHVVVDKPMTVTAAEGRALVDLAERVGRTVTPFQNRRWDGDFLTLRRLVEEGALGTVRRFESRFETWRASESKAWKAAGPATGAGVLYDLGSHVIDQALQLLGPATVLHAELLHQREGEGADDDVFVALQHDGGAVSHLWMSRVAAQLGPRFRVLGSEAGFTSCGLDPQEEQLRQGRAPGDPGFGHRQGDDVGVLGLTGEEVSVPMEAGDYAAFYRGVAASVRDGAPPVVDPLDSVAVVELIETLHRDFPVRRPQAAQAMRGRERSR